MSMKMMKNSSRRIKPQLSTVFFPQIKADGKENIPTFEELKAIEVQRRLLLHQTKSRDHRVFLMSFTATVLPSMFSDVLFYITFLIYGVVRFIAWNYPSIYNRLPPALISQMGSVGGFLTFFLVFFSSQSYNRYFSQYNRLMLAKGSIFNIAHLACSHLPHPKALRMVRWLNAAFLLAFVGISTAYEEHNFFLPLVDMYKLLTPAELDRVQEVGVDSHGIAYREVLTWVVAEIGNLQKQKMMPDKIGDSVWKEVTKVRENLEYIFDMDDQPTPFVYVHLIYLLSMFYLPLMAYTVGYNVPVDQQKNGVEFIGVTILFLTCLFVLGLRDLGFILQDPFGEDLQDLSVMHYVSYTTQMSRRILEGEKPGPCNDEEELELDRQRPVLGHGYKKLESTAFHSASTETLVSSSKRAMSSKDFSKLEDIV